VSTRFAVKIHGEKTEGSKSIYDGCVYEVNGKGPRSSFMASKKTCARGSVTRESGMTWLVGPNGALRLTYGLNWSASAKIALRDILNWFTFCRYVLY
jgi:hypothetical protein